MSNISPSLFETTIVDNFSVAVTSSAPHPAPSTTLSRQGKGRASVPDKD